MRFSDAAWRIWAKKQDKPQLWLPLVIHLMDCIDVAERLWETWLSDGVKRLLADSLGNLETAKQLMFFFAATHDIGKTSVIFQSKPSYPLKTPIDDYLIERLVLVGLDMPNYEEQINAKNSPHAFAGEVMLQIRGCPRSIGATIGSHHGMPSDFGDYNADNYYSSYGEHYFGRPENRQAWQKVQDEFFQFALEQAGYTKATDLPSIPQEAQVLYSGLLIMIDWIASNTFYYPLLSLDEQVHIIDLEDRHQEAWDKLNLPYGYRQESLIDIRSLCQERFEFKPYILQKKALEIALEMNGGIMVIEAPMGNGKTEAALLVAEMFMTQQDRTGVFFALPTQATSDGIFPRFKNWMNRLDDEQHGFLLSHGKAQFNEDFMALDRLGGSSGIEFDEQVDSDGYGGGAVVHTWFEGSKKAILADFVVGTIDQLLMVALKQKHNMLRHLGIANKVVIIDECHAYDAYMSHYLYRTLHWLGVYKVPVIILSATLPVEKRKLLVTQYLNISKREAERLDEEWTVAEDYPLITYTKDKQVFQQALPHDKSSEKSVSVFPIAEETLTERLMQWRRNGANVGIIVNTVRRAQALFDHLQEEFGDSLVLLHSSFLSTARIEKERILLSQLSKKGNRPYFQIVIGTQVLEQSLDIDFDVMITDLCPMDLLLQRIGRLHRHGRPRPKGMEKAVCYVMNMEELESGAVAIYGEFLLERTKSYLKENIRLPVDIAPLVQRVYAVEEDLSPKPKNYEQIKETFENRIKDQERRADAFRLSNLLRHKTIHSWLRKAYSGDGEAKVRDTESTIEVILVQKRHNGIYLIGNENSILANTVPDLQTAKLIARQRIRLPNCLCQKWNIDETIKTLEKQTMQYLMAWQESPWLKGELFLILDEKLQTSLNEYCLQYDENKGLMYEKEGL